MMGHKGKKVGIEGEVFDGWRHYVGWRRGAIHAIKRQFSKRVRLAAKVATRREARDTD